jgi:flagellar biosynthesis/type III secretory pathway M-ring protein FliF/YscJ
MRETAVTRETDPNAPLTALIGVVAAVLLFVIIVALQALFYRQEALERARKVESVRSEELANNIATQQERLHGYRLLDPNSGAVAIPIERARELVLKRAQDGLPLTRFSVVPPE